MAPRNLDAIQVAHDLLEEAGWGPLALADDGAVVIAVLDRGWVVVGRWSQRGSRVELTEAHVVRRWGTDQGLAQLANDGPTENTVLNARCTIRFREPRGLPLYPCNEKSWEGKL